MSSTRPYFHTSILLLLLAAGAAHAQTPDSTAAPPDSARIAVPDTLGRSPVGFAEIGPGVAVADSLLPRLPAADVVALLGRVAGAFVYDLGALGWPDGWSPDGLAPHRTALTLDGRPFDDLVTGRPRHDLLPMAWLDAPVIAAGRYGHPAAVLTRLRDFDRRRPLTELTYRASNTGLQSVMALHSQQRRRRAFGQEGVLAVVGGYGGHQATNEYAGSRLRTARQLLGRLRYTQPRWSAEVSVLHNRRKVGAHSGVEPVPGFRFESIYARLVAPVRNASARRRTIRNDFAATVRARLLPGRAEPFTASVSFAKAFFEYRVPGDTLSARARRAGVQAGQNLRLGAHALRLRADAWHDEVTRSNALPDSLGLRRTQFHLALRDDVTLGPVEIAAEGRLHEGGAGGFLRGAVGAGPLRLFAGAEHAAGPAPSWVERYGFGAVATGRPTAMRDATTAGRAGLDARAGPFDLTLFGFAHRHDYPRDFYETADDTVAVLTLDGALQRIGLAADFGWRRAARRGLYLTLQPTLTHLLDDSASTLHARQDAALPAFFGTGRFGARYRLFRQDLDLDVYVQGRVWTAMRSRTLHPATGLLVLPPAEARTVPASGTLDVVAVGRVRTATLFVAYENVLSGTVLLAGNLLVPVYPLPERQVRFGVFWPILN